MKKPVKFFIAGVLAGFTFVYLAASAAGQDQDGWSILKRVEYSIPAEAV